MRSHFELKLITSRIDFSRYSLCVPWIQDPVKERSEKVYRRIQVLEKKCQEHQIPVINPVDSLSNAIKSRAAGMLSGAGLRAAETKRVTDLEAFRKNQLGLKFPLIFREDGGHGGLVRLLKTQKDLDAFPLEKSKKPIAVEYVDVRSPEDGLFRKYRYFVIGEIGMPLHLFVSKHWEVRNIRERVVFANDTQLEEVSYLTKPDPNHEAFVCARKALGLDSVAFDYSYDLQGRLVVWEANPFPMVKYWRRKDCVYKNPYTTRVFAHMAQFYLLRAQIPIPQAFSDFVARSNEDYGKKLQLVKNA